MDSTPLPILPKIKRLLADRDRSGLVTALRQPANADLRGQAAWALGELHDIEATESLVRAALEDPTPAVQAGARRALKVLLGSNAELTIASYRGALPPLDPWLSEPEAAVGLVSIPLPEDMPEELGEADLTGMIMIVRHESNIPLRLKAIQMLARSSDLRATETLADLALWGDAARLRATAKQALEDRYGEDAESILESYRSAAGETGEDDPLEDEDDADDKTSADDLDEESEEDEDDWDEDTEDELSEDIEDEESDESDESQFSAKNRPPSPYETTRAKQSTHPVVEEMGTPWQTILWLVLVVAILAGMLILLRP